MIGRIRGRRAFERLARHGRRASTETLWCRYLDDPEVRPPRVAFAIGRSLGPAVARNRLRRRLRAAVDGYAGSPLLPSGWLLLGASGPACERTFDDLQHEVRVMLGKVVRSAPSGTTR